MMEAVKPSAAERHRKANRAYAKRAYHSDPEKFNRLKKAWNKKNPDKVSAQQARYRAKHKKRIVTKRQLQSEYHSKRFRKWWDENRERVREYRRNKLRTDVQFRISCNLRRRLHKLLRGQTKSVSAIRDLGCTVAEFVKHIESQFSSGMSWSNWGIGPGCWHIDHKTPLSSVDLTDRNQLLAVCHYTNMQPLWQVENQRKGGRAVAC